MQKIKSRPDYYVAKQGVTIMVHTWKWTYQSQSKLSLEWAALQKTPGADMLCNVPGAILTNMDKSNGTFFPIRVLLLEAKAFV